MVVCADVVERRGTGPDLFDDAPPLFALGVALVVLALRHPKHLELVLVPATDDVDAEAALANVVRRGHLLGGNERMVQWHVHGAKYIHVLRCGQQATGPGNRFKAGAIGVRLTPIALPACDGDHALDPDLICQLRQSDVVLPTGIPVLGKGRIGSAARTIGSKEPQLEGVTVHENRIALVHPRFLLSAASASRCQAAESRCVIIAVCRGGVEYYRTRIVHLHTCPWGKSEVFTRSGQVHHQAFSPRPSRGYGDWKNSQPVRRIFRLAYRCSPSHYCPEHIPMAGDDDRGMGDP